MSSAVVASNVYKKFDHPAGSPWTQRWLIQHACSHMSETAPGVAVDRVSFTVEQGEIFGLVGHHGSGKSTLIRLLAGQLPLDSGSLQIFGYDIAREPWQARRLTNRVSTQASLYLKRSPLENLLHGAQLYGDTANKMRARVVEILEQLGIDDTDASRPMVELSPGLQARVRLAQHLLSQPPLLLLDDPLAGMDEQGKHNVLQILRQMCEKTGTTVILTSSKLVDVSGLCDRVCLLEGGQLVALDTPGAFSWELKIPGWRPWICN